MFTTNATCASNLSRRYLKSIHIANVLLVIAVTINCIGFSGGSETGTLNEPLLLGTEHIEKLCVDKCPSQVSLFVRLLSILFLPRNTAFRFGVYFLENCKNFQVSVVRLRINWKITEFGRMKFRLMSNRVTTAQKFDQ